MTSKQRKIGVSLFAGALFVCTMALAQMGSGSKGSDSKTTAAMQNLNLEGELAAIPAGSDSKAAAPYAFKISKATDASGKVVSDLKGKTLDFAASGKAKDLMKEYRQGDKLVLKANVSDNKIDVISFKKAGAGSDSKMGQGSGTKK